MDSVRTLLAAIGVVALAFAIFVIIFLWSGAYDVGADSGGGIVDTIAAFTRENSVESRDADIAVPPLDSPFVVAAGAARYDHMCTGCHLAPGMKTNPMRAAMNPKPPELARRKHPDAKEDFWIVKHGIKMTAMPAWGLSLSDRQLWTLAAFLQKLPGMTPERYRALVAEGSPQNAGQMPAGAPPPAAPQPAPGTPPGR